MKRSMLIAAVALITLMLPAVVAQAEDNVTIPSYGDGATLISSAGSTMGHYAWLWILVGVALMVVFFLLRAGRRATGR